MASLSIPTAPDAAALSAPRYTPHELAERLGAHPPTDEQAAVIAADLGPRLVVAGAGSGKTATMADRVVWLVANGIVRPDQILGVTFTRKAAGELGHRIQQKVEALVEAGLEIPGWDPGEGDLGRAEVSTYHSYAASLVRDHGLRIGVEPSAVMLGAAEAHQLATSLAHAMDLDLEEQAPALGTLVSGALQLASDMAEHLVPAHRVDEHLAEVIAHGESMEAGPRGHTKDYHALLDGLRHRRLMARLAVRYAEAKREAEAMDFGDLLRHAARIAREIPEVGTAERERFAVVLLDEFQDTSHAQLEIFSGLFGAGSGEGVGHCVTAVGDPHQSIYGFRGASAGQLFSFPHRFPARAVAGTQAPDTPGLEPAAVSHLSMAWRNDRAILALANRVVEPLAAAQARTASADGAQVQPLRPRDGAPQGEVVLSEHLTSEDEAAALAAALAAAVEPGLAPPSRAVLCRSRAQFGPVMAALDEAGVEYEVLGLTGLLALPEVAEVLAVMHVLADPRRSDQLVRWLAGPRWRIGPRDLVLLRERARFVSGLTRGAPDPDADPEAEVSPEEDADAPVLLEALEDLPREGSTWRGRGGAVFSAVGLERLRAARDELRVLSRHTEFTPAELIGEIVRVTGIDVEIQLRPERSAVAARRHLNSFIDAARDFTSRAGSQHGGAAHLTAFLAWVQAAAEREHGLGIETFDPDPGAVSLLTAHASKGLEWDIVAVPGLAAGTFPTGRADRWTSAGTGALPWPLRGDRNALPQWESGWAETGTEWAQSANAVTGKAAQERRGSRPDYRDAVAEHALADERRLAYVAFTRARQRLLLSRPLWKGSNKRQQPASAFFEEALELSETVDGITVGAVLPEDQIPAENPTASRLLAAWWPFDPLEGPELVEADADDPDDESRWRRLPPRSRPRRALVERAAAAVRAADPSGTALSPRLREQIQWTLRREQALLRADDAVALPAHVSVSLYGELAADPAAVADSLRRPMPRRPAHAARRGTAFHAWLERRFEATAMLDVEDPSDVEDRWIDDSLDLGEIQAWFEASRWADRVPAFVEAPVETDVAGLSLRGRIDAVYRTGGDPQDPWDPEARWELVDWKTGAVPSGAELRQRGLQLAVYRLAWSRLHGIPLENISASFVYVAHGQERTLEDLPGEAELERILTDALARVRVDAAQHPEG